MFICHVELLTQPAKYTSLPCSCNNTVQLSQLCAKAKLQATNLIHCMYCARLDAVRSISGRCQQDVTEADVANSHQADILFLTVQDIVTFHSRTLVQEGGQAV